MDIDSKILIAAISAGSAIAGAAITQIVSIFLSHLDRKHKKKNLLREKYEELALLVHESNSWINEQMGARSLDDLKSEFPENARKATVLAHIYFPKLRQTCEKYVNACAQFQIVLVNNHQFHPDYDCGTQATNANLEALAAAVEYVRSCRQEIEDKIIKYSRSYAKA